MEQCYPVDEEYLANQRALSDHLSVQVSDVAGELIAHQDKDMHYGCWFGHYPVAAESRQFAGMRLADLFTIGAFSACSRGIPRRFLDDYIAKAPSRNDDRNISLEIATLMTEDIMLADGALSNGDRLAIAKSRVWILDATLTLDRW